MKLAKELGVLASFAALAAVLAASSATSAQQPGEVAASDESLRRMCDASALAAVTASVRSATFAVKPISNGPFKTATRFVSASASLPAFCQVVGSFVTNPATGKTANFLATFPVNWNGKYLQSGCSSHCGQFFVSDPAMPSFNVTAQGETGEVIRKGYAHFATDEGHQSMESASWAVRPDGSVDQDFVDDFFYRADKVLARAGKEFAAEFYAA